MGGSSCGLRGSKRTLGPSQGVRGCTGDAPRMHQGCTRDAPGMHRGCTKDAPRMHQRCAKDVPMVHQGCTKDASRMHQGCTKDAPRMHQGCTKDAPRIRQGPHFQGPWPLGCSLSRLIEGTRRADGTWDITGSNTSWAQGPANLLPRVASAGIVLSEINY